MNFQINQHHYINSVDRHKFLSYSHQWHDVTTLNFEVSHFPVIQKHHIRWLAPSRIQRRLENQKRRHLSFVFFNLHGALHLTALVECNKTFLIQHLPVNCCSKVIANDKFSKGSLGFFTNEPEKISRQYLPQRRM